MVLGGCPFTSTDNDGDGTSGRKNTSLEHPLRGLTWQDLIPVDFLTDLGLCRWLAVLHEKLVACISFRESNATGKLVGLKVAGESAKKAVCKVQLLLASVLEGLELIAISHVCHSGQRELGATRLRLAR